MRRVRKLVSIAFILAMATAFSALAAGPGQSSYGGTAGNAQGALAAKPTQGQLPFTGLDLAAIVGAGVLLIAVGFLLCRQHRSTS